MSSDPGKALPLSREEYIAALPYWMVDTYGYGGAVRRTSTEPNGKWVFATRAEAEALYGLWRDGFYRGFKGWTAVTFARNYFWCTGPYPYAGRHWEYCDCPGDQELRRYVTSVGLWPYPAMP